MAKRRRRKQAKGREIDLIRAYHGGDMNAEMAKVAKLLYAEAHKAFATYSRLSDLASQLHVLAERG